MMGRKYKMAATGEQNDNYWEVAHELEAAHELGTTDQASLPSILPQLMTPKICCLM